MRFHLTLLSVLLLLAAPAQSGVFDVSAVLEFSTSFGSSTAMETASGFSSVGGGIAEVPKIEFSYSASIIPPILGLDGLTISSNSSLGPGTLAGAGGALGLQGTLGIKAGALLAGSVPLTPIGGGGTAMVLVGGIFPAVLSGATWTIGAVTAVGTGTAGVTLMGLGMDSRTAGGAGTVVFVAPATFTITSAPATIPMLAELTLVYTAAPEAGAALLLAAPIAILAGLRKRGNARREANQRVRG